MRVRRLLLTAAVAGLTAIGLGACASEVSGTGSLAAGVITPGPSGSGDPSGSSSPTGGATETTDTPTPTPAPTTDPVPAKERLLCITVQGQIKSINDQFNKASTRPSQVGILDRGWRSMQGSIQRSGLPTSDKIYKSGIQVVNQLKKLVTLANRGQNPSTTPYNTAARGFSSVCGTV